MNGEWFGGLAVSGMAFAVLAAFWRQIKGLSVRALRLLVCRVDVDCPILATVVTARLLTEGRQLSSGARLVRSLHATVLATGRMILVPVDAVDAEPKVVWFRRGLLLLSTRVARGGGEPSDLPSSGSQGAQRLSISYLRGGLDVDKLLFEEAERLRGQSYGDGQEPRGAGYWVRQHDGSVGITRASGSEPRAVSGKPIQTASDQAAVLATVIGYPRDMFGEPNPPDPLACFAAGPSVAAMLADCLRWLRSRDFCSARGLPWRRGWLLHGEPGGGKSTAVRLVAQTYRLPVHTFALGTMRPQEFREAWDECQYSSPCLAVWEDVDAVFRGRENVTNESGGLTFDVILNAVSGVKPANGVLLVVTTNDVGAIDDALGRPLTGDVISRTTRPGRLDTAFRFDRPSADDRAQLARKILGGLIPHDELERLVLAADGTTISAFHQLVIDRALAHYWSEGGGGEGE